MIKKLTYYVANVMLFELKLEAGMYTVTYGMKCILFKSVKSIMEDIMACVHLENRFAKSLGSVVLGQVHLLKSDYFAGTHSGHLILLPSSVIPFLVSKTWTF